MYSHLRSRGAVVLEVALLVAFIGTIATLSQLKSEVAQERALAQYAAAEAGASGGAGTEGGATGEERTCVNGEAYKAEVDTSSPARPGETPKFKAGFKMVREPKPVVSGKSAESCDLTFCGADGTCYTVKVPPGGDLDKELDSKSGLPGATARWEGATADMNNALKSGDLGKMVAARAQLNEAGDGFYKAAAAAFGGASAETREALGAINKVDSAADGLIAAASGDITPPDFAQSTLEKAMLASKQANAELMKQALGEPTNFSRLASNVPDLSDSKYNGHPDTGQPAPVESGNRGGGTDTFGIGNKSPGNVAKIGTFDDPEQGMIDVNKANAQPSGAALPSEGDLNRVTEQLGLKDGEFEKLKVSSATRNALTMMLYEQEERGAEVRAALDEVDKRNLAAATSFYTCRRGGGECNRELRALQAEDDERAFTYRRYGLTFPGHYGVGESERVDEVRQAARELNSAQGVLARHGPNATVVALDGETVLARDAVQRYRETLIDEYNATREEPTERARFERAFIADRLASAGISVEDAESYDQAERPVTASEAAKNTSAMLLYEQEGRGKEVQTVLEKADGAVSEAAAQVSKCEAEYFCRRSEGLAQRRAAYDVARMEQAKEYEKYGITPAAHFQEGVSDRVDEVRNLEEGLREAKRNQGLVSFLDSKVDSPLGVEERVSASQARREYEGLLKDEYDRARAGSTKGDQVNKGYLAEVLARNGIAPRSDLDAYDAAVGRMTRSDVFSEEWEEASKEIDYFADRLGYSRPRGDEEGAMLGEDTTTAREAVARADNLLDKDSKYQSDPNIIRGELAAAKSQLETENYNPEKKAALEGHIQELERQLAERGVSVEVDKAKMTPAERTAFELGRYYHAQSDTARSYGGDPESWDREARIQAERVSLAVEAEGEGAPVGDTQKGSGGTAKGGTETGVGEKGGAAPVVATNGAGNAGVGGAGAPSQDGKAAEDGDSLEELGREEYEKSLKDAKLALEKARAAAPLCPGLLCTNASKETIRRAQEAVDEAEERLQEFEATNGASAARVAEAKKNEEKAKEEFNAVMRGEKNGVFCNSGCIAENERKAKEAYEVAKARREELERAGSPAVAATAVQGGNGDGQKQQERVSSPLDDASSLGQVSANTKTALAAARKAEEETSAALTKVIEAYSDPKNTTVGDKDLNRATVNSWEALQKRAAALERALNDEIPLGNERARLQEELGAVKERLGEFENDYGKENLSAWKKEVAAEDAAEAARKAAAEKTKTGPARTTTNNPPPNRTPPPNPGPQDFGLGKGNGSQNAGANPLASLLSGLQKAMGGQQKQGGAKGGSGSGGGQQNQNTACTQWPGTTLQNGQCTCPTGQSWNGSACAQQNVCAQYPGTTLVNNQCTCPQGQNWTGAKCEDSGATATSTLKAQLACSPQAQEPGEKIALSYSCANANTIRADGFTITGNKMSGELEVVATTIDATDGKMKFALTCAKEGRIEEARCEVAVSKAFIVLIATPSTVESGKPTKIGWITGGMKASDDGCSLKKKGSSDSLKQGRSSVYETPNITDETTYVLSCTTSAGFSKTAEVVVKIK